MFLLAVAALNDVELAALEEALKTGQVQLVLDLLRLDRLGAALAAPGSLKDLLRQALVGGAEATAAQAPAALGIEVTFRQSHSAAVLWAERHAGDLIREVTEDQVATVRNLIAGAFRDGLPPRQAAKRIREVVGLTRHQAGMVARFRARLEADDVPAEAVDRRTARYAEALLRRRALTIARTETLRAANQGQRALWQQAVADGQLDAAQWREVWLVTMDDRLCAGICEPIPELKENRDVPVGGSFVTGAGDEVDGPPAHPQCRCAVALKRKD